VSVAGLLLTPGASAGRDSPPLVAVEEALRPLPVLRIDFPNRASGSRAPERAPVAIAHVRSTASALAQTLGVEPEQIVLGGRSFGGRMCSMAVAEGQPAAGLVLLSYPLHPPGRPDQLRIAHLTALNLPVLAVSGERDPFGTPDELRTHLSAIPGPLTTVFVPGTHSPSNNGAVAQAVKDWLATIG
jgi:predicted alpha/beta-hydrolase family hydrolase